MTTQDLVGVIKKNPISFGCGALSLLLVVGIYLRSDAIPDAEATLNQKSAEAERLTLNLQYSTQLKEHVDVVTAASAVVDSGVVRASQLGNNTQYFYKVEHDTGVKLMDLRQNTPAVVAKPAKGSFIPVGFTVSAQGSLKQLLDFLRRIESGTHYSRVMTASLVSNASQRSGPLTLTLNVELLGQP